MERIKYIGFQIFVSPEFISSVLLILIYLLSNQPFLWLGERLISNELLLYAPTVPFILFTTSLTNTRKILLPSLESRKKYLEWDGYQLIKDTTFIGLFYLLIGLVISVIPLIIEADVYKDLIGLLMTIAYVVSLWSSVTMFFASYKVEEILEVNT